MYVHAGYARLTAVADRKLQAALQFLNYILQFGLVFIEPSKNTKYQIIFDFDTIVHENRETTPTRLDAKFIPLCAINPYITHPLKAQCTNRLNRLNYRTMLLFHTIHDKCAIVDFLKLRYRIRTYHTYIRILCIL